MKRNILLIMMLAVTLSLTACSSKKETAVVEKNNPAKSTTEEEVDSVEENGIGEELSGINEDGIGEEFSGINEDSMGYDSSYGEGIGEVIALTPEEESYMRAQNTNSWLELSQQEKADLVVLVGRSLEESDGFIVEDYDDLVLMLDHQMEQYYRNGVNESVLATVRDICGIN